MVLCAPNIDCEMTTSLVCATEKIVIRN